METLGCDGAQARVGVAEDEQGVGLYVGHQLVGAVDDVADSCAEVVAHGIHVDLGVGELQVLEEHAVEVVVVVLSGVRENHVEVLAALVDGGCQTDNLGTCADDNQQFESAIVLKRYV